MYRLVALSGKVARPSFIEFTETARQLEGIIYWWHYIDGIIYMEGII